VKFCALLEFVGLVVTDLTEPQLAYSKSESMDGGHRQTEWTVDGHVTAESPFLNTWGETKIAKKSIAQIIVPSVKSVVHLNSEIRK